MGGSNEMRMEDVRSKKVIGEGEKGTCPVHLLRSGTKGRQVILHLDLPQ